MGSFYYPRAFELGRKHLQLLHAGPVLGQFCFPLDGVPTLVTSPRSFFDWFMGSFCYPRAFELGGKHLRLLPARPVVVQFFSPWDSVLTVVTSL